MGPRSRERGNRIAGVGSHTGSADCVASMGPRSSERGNESGARAGKHDRPASMGPRSESAETWLSHLRVHRLAGFNGAALVGARKPAPPSIDLFPHRNGFNGAALLSAETAVARNSGSLAAAMASMGPRSSERGNCRRLGVRLRRCYQLQWGRALGSAETPRASCGAGSHRRASMGPRFRKRGNCTPMFSTPFRRSRASMGPRSRKRGNCRLTSTVESPIVSFNGAALSEARKLAR